MAIMTSTEIISYVRTVLELSTDEVSDAKMTLFVNKWIAYYNGTITELNQWLITYYTALDALRSMIFSSSIEQASVGNVSRREEQRGSERISVYYNTTSTSTSSTNYQNLLDLLLENPSYIHTSLAPSVLNIAIGGVSESTTSEIKQDPDSRSASLGVGWLHDEEYNLTGTSPQPRIFPRGTYGDF